MSTPLPPSPDPVGIASRTSGDDSVILAVVTSAGIGCACGAASGLLWGGVGGRIAMRIVMLTSSDAVRGVTSDDGFEIGTFSGATVFLLIFTTILGAIAGCIYGLIRMITAGPTWAVAAAVTVATAAAGGAGIVHVDGIDFRFLEPLWLTAGLFVLIPGMWALTVVLATEHLLRPDGPLPDLPGRIHRRVWGATGWVLLGGLTVIGLDDLVSDITRLA
jgi:hypothetical protein